jgi:hypothetical protein
MVSKAALGFQPFSFLFLLTLKLENQGGRNTASWCTKEDLRTDTSPWLGTMKNTWTGLGNSGPHIDTPTIQVSMDFFMYFEMKSWNMKFTGTKDGWHSNLAKTDNIILRTKKAFHRWSEFRKKGSLLMGCMMTVHSRAYNIGKIRPPFQKEEENDWNWWGSWK